MNKEVALHTNTYQYKFVFFLTVADRYLYRYSFIENWNTVF